MSSRMAFVVSFINELLNLYNDGIFSYTMLALNLHLIQDKLCNFYMKYCQYFYSF